MENTLSQWKILLRIYEEDRRIENDT